MLALIDGDGLAYFCCRSRYQNKDGFVSLQTEKPVFTPEQDAKYLEESWTNFKRIVAETIENTWASEYLMAMKGPGNYRDDIFPIREEDGKLVGYKASRYKAPEDSNQFVPEIRRRAIESGLAIEAIGREADDFVRIWAVQAEAAGDPFTVCTNDKDMKVIGGKFYNTQTKETFKISLEEGIRFYHEQLLMGDAVDSIPGLPGIGPVKAKKMLSDCVDVEEFRITIVAKYMDVFGDDWRNQLLSNGKLLYLQKHEHDFFNLDGWPEL